jgi:hypothetical protein
VLLKLDVVWDLSLSSEFSTDHIISGSPWRIGHTHTYTSSSRSFQDLT